MIEYLPEALTFLLTFLIYRRHTNRFHAIISESILFSPYLTILTPIIQKIHFMYLPYFTPLLGYQKNLLQNCDSIQESKYLIMGVNSYFRGNGYLAYHWNDSFKNLVFSKKIIMMSEEDVKINFQSFNFNLFRKNIQYVIGSNTKSAMQTFFKTPNVFTHLSFLLYVENHRTSYEEFVKRKFFIQTAISNMYYCVNSNRIQYLRACMNRFGRKKVANYGAVFKNQNLPKDRILNSLPPTAYFGFAMENSIAEFWITEKLFFMYRNDVIPIYRGSIKNREILKSYGVNLNAFVDASNMTVNELVNYLSKLIKEKGKKKLYEIYSQPLIPDKQFFEEQIKNNFQKLINDIDKL